MVRAIEWVDDGPAIRLIEQTLLPHREEYVEVTTVDSLVAAIGRLVVRGAPALGAAGAFGVALAMAQAEREGWTPDQLQAQLDRVRDARPTAVNLAWGVAQVRGLVPHGAATVLAAARQVMADDTNANATLARLGADWLIRHLGDRRDRIRVVTHCNTGALATTAIGTAYGIIHELHRRGRLGLVYVDETRPLLQGTRLTSWELTQDGIEHVIQADGAASGTILRGMVDVAIFGADRIAANGDTANKVGSVALALACQRAGIPCVVAAPWSTIDLATATGADIDIEERDPAEVLAVAGVPTAPVTARAWNPAFDVTEHDLITAIVTERGIVEPAAHPAPDLLARLAR